MQRHFFFFSLLIYQLTFIYAYKPVAIVHGLLDEKYTMDFMANYIQKAHPGTEVNVLDILHGYESLQPIWIQVSKFGDLLTEMMRKNPDGIHLIGYSQGGLICRGLLSTLKNHTINNFISLSSPQMGQYGDTDYLRLLFPNYMKSNIYRIFYTNFGQRFSVANFWKDPHHIDLYLKYSAFLAQINNETITPFSIELKKNFLRLKKLILIGGPDDGVITPWQSSHFGYYDDNENIVEMTDQDVYKQDSFGLKTLNLRKSIFTYSVPDITHLKWHSNTTVLDNYVLPYLT